MADVNSKPGIARATPTRNAEPGPANEPVRFDIIELLFFAYRDFVGDPHALLREYDFGRAHHRALYFVSDARGTKDLYVQKPVQSAAKQLFDALGDVAAPRLSPDGRSIAYIGYTRDATGDACVRALADLETERCLTGPDTAELEVVWLDGGARLGVLSRTGMQAGFVLRSFPAAGGTPTVLAKRDAIGLARSPDGRWLAFVTVTPRQDQVGVAFASRVGKGVHVARLSEVSNAAADLVYTPPLPGVSGFPAFSPDGRYLYFSQYLNDTNGDGVIDGSDHSVIERVRFDPSRRDPFGPEPPEQLTSARWDCHYPSASGETLLMTCSRRGSLDLYTLPLDGAVPDAWDAPRLRGELEVARDLSTRLLLANRLLAKLDAPAARLPVLRQIVWMHLSLGEFEAAIYYAHSIERETAGPSSTQAASAQAAPGADARWAGLMVELAEHRRADRGLARGELSSAYIRQERARLDRIRAAEGELPTATRSVRPTTRDASPLGECRPTDIPGLAKLVQSEILDDLGDKAGALAALRAVSLEQLSDRYTLRLAGERAAHLYGLLADRPAWLAALRTLALHPALGEAEHIAQAHAFTVTLLAGLARGRARGAAIERARATAPDGSALALLLDVEAALNDLRPDGSNEDAVRARIFDLYKADHDPEHRRALALTTINDAARRGNEYLEYQFTTTWASGVRHADPERKYAESLYRTVVLERAYGELSDGHLKEAAAYFFQATRNTDALDPHIGFIETRLAEGQSIAALRAFYAERFKDAPAAPEHRFVEAYLTARGLAGVAGDDAHASAVAEVERLLREVSKAMPRRLEVRHLWGYTLQQAALRTGSRAQAASALRHYELALDLARDRPRARAAILEALGELQASLGEHRAAVASFVRRARLPFPRPASELALRLSLARSLFHTRAPCRGREEAAGALAFLDARPALGGYRASALDRLAFAHLTCGEPAEAARRYAELERALTGAAGTPINRFKAALALGSASLAAGEPAKAAEALRRARALLDAHPDLEARAPEHALVGRFPYPHARYAVLVDGLLASALVGTGDRDGAGRALARRLDGLETIFKRSDADEDLLDIARTHLRLAALARAAGRPTEAVAQLEAGLARADAYDERTGSTVTPTRLELIRAYAEARLFGDLPAKTYHRDLAADLSSALDFVARFRNPDWREDRLRFALYLTLARLHAGTGVAGAASAPQAQR